MDTITTTTDSDEDDDFFLTDKFIVMVPILLNISTLQQHNAQHVKEALHNLKRCLKHFHYRMRPSLLNMNWF